MSGFKHFVAAALVAYCAIWQWAALRPTGELFTARNLNDMPADLRDDAKLVLLIPLDIQQTPMCQRKRNEGETPRDPFGDLFLNLDDEIDI